MPQPPLLAVVPPPALHNSPSYFTTLPVIRPAISRTRQKAKTKPRTDTDSLFGSSSDSEPEASSSQQPPAVLASPRKKRGARLTQSRQAVAASTTRNNHTYTPNPPVNPDDTYGDPPHGEYEPSDGFRVFQPSRWMNWELPEHRPPGNDIPLLPPIFAHSRKVDQISLDGEPPTIRKALDTLGKTKNSQGSSHAASRSATDLAAPTVGFEGFWTVFRDTEAGKEVERGRTEARAKEEEKQRKRDDRRANKGKGRADGEQPTASGSNDLFGLHRAKASSGSLMMPADSMDSDDEEDIPLSRRPGLISPARKSGFKVRGSKMRLHSPT